MKTLRNSIQLLGNTGRDVEVMTFESGSKKASVSFATTEYYKNAKGELVENTQWHNLIAWGKTGELLSKAASKGDRLLVNGSIQYRTYEGKDGGNRQITEILVRDFMRINKKEAEAKKPAKKQKEALPF